MKNLEEQSRLYLQPLLSSAILTKGAGLPSLRKEGEKIASTAKPKPENFPLPAPCYIGIDGSTD